MEEERLQVLKLLEAGTITADQAVELLNALRPGLASPEAAWSIPPGAPPAPRIVPPAVAPASVPYWRIGGARISFGPHDRSAPTVRDEWAGRGGLRWVRIRVLDGQGRSKVDVQLPIGVLGLFIRMGARWLPNLRAFDPEILLAAVQLRRGGKLFEAVDEEDGDRVEITVE